MRLAHLAPLALAAGALARSPEPKLLPRDEAALLERGLAEDILEDIKDGFSCAGCETLILLLKGLAALGDDAFVGAVQGVCKLAQVADDDVCEGAVELEGPIIAEALREVKPGSHHSQLVCMTFLGVCGWPEVTPHEVALPSEKPEDSTRPAPSGRDPIKVVHYSDVHVDHLYVPGSSANCTKPICCRPYTEDDEPGVSDSPAGPNGDHNCDTPVPLADSMYAAITDVAPDAAFAICTGDIVDHTIWNTSYEYNTFSIKDAYERMGRSLPLVYATAGNHEAHPTNAFPPLNVSPSNGWLYDLLSSTWESWIGSAAATSTSHFGAYAAKYADGPLRIISLNTNMWYTQNYWLYQPDSPNDPDGQIEWLATELDNAEKNGERAYVIGHMAPGDHDAFHDQSNYLDQVINRYSDTIAGMFFGHTHLDEFQVSYSDYENPTAAKARAVSYIAPSLAPTSGHPAFKVYHVDPETFAVLDAETWIADMGNPTFQETPTWTKLYSAKEAYLPDLPAGAELSPAAWHNVTTALESNPDLLTAYLSRKTRGWTDAEEEPCDDACRETELCKLRGARSQDNCHVPSLGSGFRKRSEEKRGHADDCGSSIMSGVLGVLGTNEDAVKLVKGKVEEKRSLLI